MGIEGGAKTVAGLEDIKLAMKGHVKDGYKFNHLSTLSEDDNNYNKTPTLKDQVHVLVCVISASTANIMSAEYHRKMRNVRLAARDLGIHQLAILTKIDVACPEVKADIRNAYKSKCLKEMVDALSAALGFTPNCIFPVKNYHSEIDTNDDVDTLLLSALKRIVSYGEDFVNSE